MKLSKACLAFVVPMALIWGCGSSTTGDNGGGAATGSGADASGGSGANGSGANGSGASLAVGGDGLAIGGDGAVANGGSTGSTASGGGINPSGGVDATGTTACTNGEDDDGDGLSDGFDPECTGASDNDEGTFATGIPGDNRDPKWQDCFFDGNSGAGDDDCRYATGCLTGDLEPEHDDCQLTDACIKFCAPLTPNGCDCFGCCTVQLPSGDTVDITTSSTCSVEKIDDEQACARCVKTDTCGNTCGRCELCPGKTVADLPDDCGTPPGGGGSGSGGSASTGGATNTGGSTTGGSNPGYTCEGGLQVCGSGLPSCGLGKYCSQGCCLEQPPK